jgi:lipid A 3-O-deacylase
MRAPAFPFAARACLGPVLLAIAGRASAIDGTFVTAGTGNHVDIVGVGLASPEWKRWTLHGGWSLALNGVAGVALWEGRDHPAANRHVVDFNLYPVFRLDRGQASGVVAYLEGSVGVNLLSSTRINEDREFSTAFQFGEFLGVGISFGPKLQYDLGLRVQHVSNGNIKLPNDGLTFGSAVFQYRFD